jgi:ferrous iron transport protein A
MQTLVTSHAPLNLYQAGTSTALKVLLIQGGWETRRCFNEMGIHSGDQVRVLRKAPFGGPLVIENQGTQVAIGKQLAEKVQVKVLP